MFEQKKKTKIQFPKVRIQQQYHIRQLMTDSCLERKQHQNYKKNGI